MSRSRCTRRWAPGLFDFGFRDGPAADALLQHPLGVAVLPDGSIAVADTYNGAVRRFADGELTTLAVDLAEPSGLHVEDGHLVVVESAAHRLTRVPLGASAAAADFSHTTQRPVTDVGPRLSLEISFTPPPGQKVDDRFGPPSQLMVTATPPALIREGEGRGTDLQRTLVLDPAVGDGVLHVAARAASCDEGGGDGAACHMHQQDWGVPVRVRPDGVAVLDLPLGGAAGSATCGTWYRSCQRRPGASTLGSAGPPASPVAQLCGTSDVGFAAGSAAWGGPGGRARSRTRHRAHVHGFRTRTPYCRCSHGAPASAYEGVTMGIGLGIILLVLGLILLTGAVDLSALDEFIASETLGWILVIAGVLSLVLALVMNQQRSRTTHVEERREV